MNRIEKATKLLLEGLEKARKMPIGTVSKSGKYKKIAEGKWVPIEKRKNNIKKEKKKEKDLDGSKSELDASDFLYWLEDRERDKGAPWTYHDVVGLTAKEAFKKLVKEGRYDNEGGDVIPRKNDKEWDKVITKEFARKADSETE